ELLQLPVPLAPGCADAATAQLVQNLEPGRLLLQENLRFHAEEEANGPEFARQLSQNIDVFVKDAFGAAHRAQASTEGMARVMTQQCTPAVAGNLMGRELTHLTPLLHSPTNPFVAILGGSKVTDKIEVIENLLPQVSSLLIGGAMTYAFLKA